MPYAIYQAGPIFSEAEQHFHRALSASLRRAGHEVIWSGCLFTDAQLAKAGPHAPDLLFKGCRDAIGRCNCVVALLDGTQVDDGTAWELGYAHAKGIPIYGLRTDFRQAGDTKYNYVNSMIQGCLSGFARSVEELVGMLTEAEPTAGQEAECPCLNDNCLRRGDCISCFNYHAESDELPCCLKPENFTPQAVRSRVVSRLKTAGLLSGNIK